MEDDAKVEVTSLNEFLTAGDTINVTWSPLTLLQGAVIMVDPNSFTVNIQMYEVQMTSNGNYAQHEIAVLASSIPNNGKATVTIPTELFHNTTEPVHSVNILVNLNNQLLIRKRFIGASLQIGLWSVSVIAIASQSLLYDACKAWALLEPAGIGPELLDRVTQTAPCPPNVGQAETVNSGLVEDEHNFLISIFHPDADKCFRQKIITKYYAISIIDVT